MSTPQEKGDALETAVAAIEEVILQSSLGTSKKPLIEKKKIIRVNEVRHEIDIYVTAHIAPGYKSIFIFECKNWQKAVSKNEIIVFSEKIDASRATSGCFVAKSYSSDAVAQAERDPRITLLLAAEFGPDSGPELFQFFTRTPEMTKIDLTMARRGCHDLTKATVLSETAEIKYQGRTINYKEVLLHWSQLACQENLLASFADALPAGVYHHTVDRELPFSTGELIVNDLDIERLVFHIEYQVAVTQVPVVSHFEVASRGRYISFAPQVIGNDTMQWQIVMPAAK